MKPNDSAQDRLSQAPSPFQDRAIQDALDVMLARARDQHDHTLAALVHAIGSLCAVSEYEEASTILLEWFVREVRP